MRRGNTLVMAPSKGCVTIVAGTERRELQPAAKNALPADSQADACRVRFRENEETRVIDQSSFTVKHSNPFGQYPAGGYRDHRGGKYPTPSSIDGRGPPSRQLGRAHADPSKATISATRNATTNATSITT